MKKLVLWQATFFHANKKQRFSEKLFYSKEAIILYCRMCTNEDKTIIDWDINKVIYEDYNDLLK